MVSPHASVVLQEPAVIELLQMAAADADDAGVTRPCTATASCHGSQLADLSLSGCSPAPGFPNVDEICVWDACDSWHKKPA